MALPAASKPQRSRSRFVLRQRYIVCAGVPTDDETPGIASGCRWPPHLGHCGTAPKTAPSATRRNNSGFVPAKSWLFHLRYLFSSSTVFFSNVRSTASLRLHSAASGEAAASATSLPAATPPSSSLATAQSAAARCLQWPCKRQLHCAPAAQSTFAVPAATPGLNTTTSGAPPRGLRTSNTRRSGDLGGLRKPDELAEGPSTCSFTAPSEYNASPAVAQSWPNRSRTLRAALRRARSGDGPPEAAEGDAVEPVAGAYGASAGNSPSKAASKSSLLRKRRRFSGDGWSASSAPNCGAVAASGAAATGAAGATAIPVLLPSEPLEHLLVEPDTRLRSRSSSCCK
mmetsp:Transcript_75969/g.217601  ORF Transcript_75969/g.217601 Transcript_75969/m.217601 type:complete len:342 (-) Transcript_75969:1274-2299(-)